MIEVSIDRFSGYVLYGVLLDTYGVGKMTVCH
jgi:hypothetical protein